MPVQSFLKKFRPEFLEHAETHRCRFGDHGWGLTQAPRDAVAGPVRYPR
jgi:NADH-quinone oxidoreductase subunit F